jgi:hypothetical protein
VIGFDLNPLAIFIVNNMVRQDYNLKELNTSYGEIKKYLNYLFSDFNKIEFITENKQFDKTLISIEWNELAYIVKCNQCNNTLALSNENKISNGRYSYLNSSCKGNKKNNSFIEPVKCERIGYEYLFFTAKSPLNKKYFQVPYDSERKKIIKKHITFLQLCT